MMTEIAQLLELECATQLSSLRPVSETDIERIATSHPGISKQYLEFIRRFGVGKTTTGFYFYEPDPASSFESNQSYQLYQSAAYRALSGPGRARDDIPADAVCVADSGASWRYCLCPSLGEGVFCLDMGGPTFEPTTKDFISFVTSHLSVD